MKVNPVRRLWSEGKTVTSGWMHIPSAYSAEICASAGYDSMVIDMQHGPVDYESAVGMLQVINADVTAPFVRVPWNEPVMIQRVLDAGAIGIICPMVSNRAECERFVGAVKYPPVGYRSNGAFRAARLFGGDYPAWSNDFVVAMAMIETREAFEKLDEILDTPGLDAIFVGPSDLSLSMYGYVAMDHVTEPMLGHMEEIARRATAKGIPAGLYTITAEYAKRAVGMGYRFLTSLPDDYHVSAGMRANAQALRDASA